MSFVDRKDAGQQLADKLAQYEGKNTVVIAIPRGGVVIGKEIADALHAPLSVVLVRKISHPYHAEYAIGAISEKGTPIYNQHELADVGPAWLEEAEESARQMIKRRREIYFGKTYKRPSLKGKTVVIVDDGMATGLSMQAAVQALEGEGTAHIIIAVPAASPLSYATLKDKVEDIVVLENPNNFMGAVGEHYINFEQVSDDEVHAILKAKH
jgi:putative phosphoribosyl transferase